jgi:hypothetical protein
MSWSGGAELWYSRAHKVRMPGLKTQRPFYLPTAIGWCEVGANFLSRENVVSVGTQRKRVARHTGETRKVWSDRGRARSRPSSRSRALLRKTDPGKGPKDRR